MILCPALKSGQTIALIAPGSLEEAATILPKAKNFLESKGFNVNVPTWHSHDDPFSLFSPEERFLQICQGLEENVRAVWAIRGGYGSMQLLPLLNRWKSAHVDYAKDATPKLLIGFSDITMLHSWWNQELGWPSLHGKMVKQFIDNLHPQTLVEEDVAGILSILTGKTNKVVYEDLQPMNSAASDFEPLEGMICGGNLTVVANSLGTPWQIQTKDKILLLEDINEEGYRIDRSLWHLELAHIIHGVKAVLLGDFTDNSKNSDNNRIQMALERAALRWGSQGIPVFRIPQVGHAMQNRPIPFHTRSIIYQSEEGRYCLQSLTQVQPIQAGHA